MSRKRSEDLLKQLRDFLSSNINLMSKLNYESGNLDANGYSVRYDNNNIIIYDKDSDIVIKYSVIGDENYKRGLLCWVKKLSNSDERAIEKILINMTQLLENNPEQKNQEQENKAKKNKERKRPVSATVSQRVFSGRLGRIRESSPLNSNNQNTSKSSKVESIPRFKFKSRGKVLAGNMGNLRKKGTPRPQGDEKSGLVAGNVGKIRQKKQKNTLKSRSKVLAGNMGSLRKKGTPRPQGDEKSGLVAENVGKIRQKKQKNIRPTSTLISGSIGNTVKVTQPKQQDQFSLDKPSHLRRVKLNVAQKRALEEAKKKAIAEAEAAELENKLNKFKKKKARTRRSGTEWVGDSLASMPARISSPVVRNNVQQEAAPERLFYKRPSVLLPGSKLEYSLKSLSLGMPATKPSNPRGRKYFKSRDANTGRDNDF